MTRNDFIHHAAIAPLRRICNPAATSIRICNPTTAMALQMPILSTTGLQIPPSGETTTN